MRLARNRVVECTRKNKDILVFNPAKNDYENSIATIDDDIQQLLKLKDPARKFFELRESTHPQAQFLWAIHRDLFHYCAVYLSEIADNARDLDLAVRWGFGWTLGPFEIWQAAGWIPIAQWINEDIAAGKAMSQTPLPNWVKDLEKLQHQAFIVQPVLLLLRRRDINLDQPYPYIKGSFS